VEKGLEIQMHDGQTREVNQADLPAKGIWTRTSHTSPNSHDRYHFAKTDLDLGTESASKNA